MILNELSNIHIDTLVRALSIKNFKGCFMLDNLPGMKRGDTCIINLDNSHGHGTHWTALFHGGNMLLYFDSFGLPPPDELKLKYHLPVQFSTSQIQDLSSVACGWYALTFLDNISRGITFYDFVFGFGPNYKKNEQILKNRFNKIISSSLI